VEFLETGRLVLGTAFTVCGLPPLLPTY
jgi:hypothetical protein